MRKRRHILLFLLVGLFISPSGFPPARAAVYKYVDESGTVHFTDRYESIPPKYRPQVGTIPEKEDLLTPEERRKEREREEAERRAGEERGRREREAEEKREAEARKARQEKEAEEKARERAEKEKRIEDLRAQIEAKRQQQNSLRTTWMVNDRRMFLQLNDEIQTLSAEIRAIQRELGGGQPED